MTKPEPPPWEVKVHRNNHTREKQIDPTIANLVDLTDDSEKETTEDQIFSRN